MTSQRNIADKDKSKGKEKGKNLILLTARKRLEIKYFSKESSKANSHNKPKPSALLVAK